MESHVPVRTRIAAELRPVVAVTRRNAARTEVTLDAGIFSGSTHGSLCRVTDLSLSGARLQTFGDLVPGGTILLTLPHGVSRPTRVVWSHDYEAGCRFETPLSLLEFELLVAG